MDERKFDVQSVCDCCHPLCPSSVWTHYDCVPENGITLRLDEDVKKLKPPPAFDVLLDPLEDGGLRVQVVDGDVEEALDLARVQVHRDYVVCPGHLVNSYQFCFGFSCLWLGILSCWLVWWYVLAGWLVPGIPFDYREHVGHELGRDWSARFVLLVLPAQCT